ncbi:MAG TPA: universal stress protein [Ktedonobacteraceae bacterium]|nr:universal stress protein [Ktedonobacteraceae bacterium]
MFQKILVPLDGSGRAEQAIPVAARIARASEGTVILLAVATFPNEFHPEEKRRAEVDSPRLIDENLNQARQYLNSVTRMPELAGVKTRVEALIGGVAPTIMSAIELLQADLVVMCSHGYSGFKRWALGSVAQIIVPHSPVPVLLLRDGGPLLVGQSVRVLVPLDGSPLAEAALKPAIELITALAPADQRSLHLIRVVDDPISSGIFRPNVPFDLEVSRAEARREAHKYLAGMAAQLTKGEFATYDLTVTTSVSVNNDVAEALVEKTEQTVEPFDLIAMAAHGYGGVQRWAMGSITERVLHHTKQPLLIVHADAH